MVNNIKINLLIPLKNWEKRQWIINRSKQRRRKLRKHGCQTSCPAVYTLYHLCEIFWERAIGTGIPSVQTEIPTVKTGLPMSFNRGMRAEGKPTPPWRPCTQTHGTPQRGPDSALQAPSVHARCRKHCFYRTVCLKKNLNTSFNIYISK